MVGCSVCAFIVLVWLREQITVHGGPDWLEAQDEPLPQLNLPGVARGLFGGGGGVRFRQLLVIFNINYAKYKSRLRSTLVC